MRLCGGLSLLLLSCSAALALVVPSELPDSKLSLGSSQLPLAMTYQFVTEHRPILFGENNYIKPGNVVGSFIVGDARLQVKRGDVRKPIASKHNILFVAYPKEQLQAEA